MAENKKSVLLYCDIIHTVNVLTNEEAGILFKHYLAYINDLDPEPPDRTTQIVFEPIKQNLKRDLLKWEKKSEKNADIAKESWIKRKDANAYERIKLDANHADKDKDTVTVTVKVKDKVKVIKNKYPSETEFLEYTKEVLKEKYGTLEFSLKAKFTAWSENNWIDGNGKKITNWKTKILNTIPFLKPSYDNSKKNIGVSSQSGGFGHL